MGSRVESRLIKINQQREEERLFEEQQALIRKQQRDSEKTKSETDKARKERERAQKSSLKIDKLLQTSGVMSDLQDLEHSIGERFPKHSLLIDRGEDMATLTLVWGNKFKIENNSIIPEELSFGKYELDCFVIKATIYDSDEDDEPMLTVFRGGEVYQSQWRKNPNATTDAIALAYENPKKIAYSGSRWLDKFNDWLNSGVVHEDHTPTPDGAGGW